MKTEFRQVFDEAKEKWVLKKVPLAESVRNRVGNSESIDHLPQRADTPCLNCGRAWRSHYLGYDNYIVCTIDYATSSFFEYLT